MGLTNCAVTSLMGHCSQRWKTARDWKGKLKTLWILWDVLLPELSGYISCSAANISVCDVATVCCALTYFLIYWVIWNTKNSISYFILLYLQIFRGVQICVRGRGNNNDLDEEGNRRLTRNNVWRTSVQSSPVQSSPECCTVTSSHQHLNILLYSRLTVLQFCTGVQRRLAHYSKNIRTCKCALL